MARSFFSFWDRRLAKARKALERGALAEAKTLCLAIAQAGRADLAALHLLGRVCEARDEHTEAIEWLSRALSVAPDFIPARLDLGKALLLSDRLAEAEVTLAEVIKVRPEDPIAHNLIGMILRNQGDAAAAEAHFRKAIALNANLIDAHVNLGAVLNEQGKGDEAEAAFRRAVEANPKNALAWCNLGLVLAEKGLQEEAEQCFQRALDADPGYFYARLSLVTNKLKEVYESEGDIARSRAAYREALEDLVRRAPADERQLASAAQTVGWVTPFFLPYQGENDRGLQETYGRFVCDLMARRFPDLAYPLPAPSLQPGERLRVGIVSGFFLEHSVWKNPIRGWLENIDRSQFDVRCYYTGHREDAQTAAARRACAHFVERLPFEALARKILQDRLHVAIFPEIGMDAVTTKLAALRLAPVQCNSWGHPTTSGMPTMDYFLSSELMEPRDGDAYYSEKLIRLPNLSVHYTPTLHAGASLVRGQLGVREGAVVYFCAQSLFKYLPQHDALFTQIAREIEDCQFVFISAQRSRLLTEKFYRRIAREFESQGLPASRHLVILPRMDGRAFQAVARLSDVFLDSIGWSGCNSALESMIAGLLPVTCAGSSMRARHTYAFLKMMGMDELIAADRDAYARLAVRVGRERAWREELRGRMAARLPKLFGDVECVRGLEAFLQSAVAKRMSASA